ncbi:MAG: hypothetical protein AB1736_02295 [Chloroflexota bacterium]
MSRERDRYPRMTLRDQLEELVGWVRTHRLVVLGIAIVVTYVVTQVILPPAPVRPEDLRVGDCLYVRTAATSDLAPGVRPIGERASVGVSLLGGGADQAACDASHGHEVSAVIDLPEQPATSPLSPGLDPACEGAFGSYVGLDLASSMYETFAVVPDDAHWAAGFHRAICLVARADGEWMSHPARDSGE